MATRRAADGPDRAADTCVMCAAETQHPFDPTPLVPEYGAELISATFCSAACAFALLASFIDARRPDQLALLQQRFAGIKSR